ncbi:hypothetical protein D5F01_LYC01603 [Larimichthys crocea]|uniref:Ig-like domain-containing protein n=1 Tax=Larimichthys crocea TaxID=215358 RepID=A0A6G0J678_LARCR|nr:hypothetical protein D5F01_LYC01603 [Larimichthys crocea]
MDRLPYTYLLIFCCLTFGCSFGRGQDSSPSCDVGVMVRRGTTKKAAAQQRLTVECPVKHCGESVNVTWCKLLETNQWEQINQTENVEITQQKYVDRLTSFLTFKRISIHDDGLYRCNLLTGDISHIINITVSAEVPSDAGKEDVSWLSYFSICVSVILLVITVSVLTALSFYGWKRRVYSYDA